MVVVDEMFFKLRNDQFGDQKEMSFGGLTKKSKKQLN
jgi:hypothetical protein